MPRLVTLKPSVPPGFPAFLRPSLSRSGLAAFRPSSHTALTSPPCPQPTASPRSWPAPPPPDPALPSDSTQVSLAPGKPSLALTVLPQHPEPIFIVTLMSGCTVTHPPVWSPTVSSRDQEMGLVDEGVMEAEWSLLPLRRNVRCLGNTCPLAHPPYKLFWNV